MSNGKLGFVSKAFKLLINNILETIISITMSTQFTREQIKICVAKMCLTIGWHTSMTTPIEILTDILSNYLFQLGRATNDYANGFGMTEPNLDHLGLAFRDFHVNLSELEEYVKYVDFVEPPTSVPKYPLPKEDHLNFLKPGSKEVVTRQVHIHEHLPPMNPVLEVSENETEANIKKEKCEDLSVSENSNPVFKRPAEISQGEAYKRPRLLLEEEGRPTREISSVMMTTSGFLSPAREGKLPESRTPMPALEPIAPPPIAPPIQPEPSSNKKPVKVVKKVERKKDKVGRELFKPISDHPVKKVTSVKDIVKSKMKSAPNANAPVGANNFMLINDVKISLVSPNNKLGSPNQTKFNKALAAARLKTEKLNTTITPIPPKIPVVPPPPPPIKIEPHVDKLFTEPDKRKINILKKISVKNEKLEKILKIKDEIKQESRESSPDLIIDESAEVPAKVHHLSSDITIELINSMPSNKSPEKVEQRSYFDDDSPPGTPSTPKTPEMISQSPPLNRVEKRKRKDKSKVKKVQKQASPVRLDPETVDIDMERPKTPEAHLIIKQEKQELPPVTPSIPPFPFFSPFAGPGLIPPPLSNPLFPHLPIPPLGIPSFGQPPYIPPVHPGMPMNFMQPIKQEEVVPKSPPVEKAPPVINPPIPIEKDVPSPKTEKKSKEHKKDKKDKLKKKNKKDKVKNKSEKKKLKEEKKDKEKTKKEKREKRKDKEIREGEIAVPKLTLKLGSASPHPDSPDTRKLNIKPIIKKEEEPAVAVEPKREMSPELAKISALVTGQPKPKSTNNTNANPAPTDTYPTSSNDSFNMKKSMFKPIPKIRTKEIPKEPIYGVDLNNTPASYVSMMRMWLQEEESVKEEVASTHTVVSPRAGPGPGRPRIHPIKAKSTKLNKQQQQTMVKDSDGNKVWICPACGKQDDGSPMIGCDDCDAWYHWVCVGIQVPPDDSEDWYCRLCISKKQEVLQTDKKKKRKKREKKEH